VPSSCSEGMCGTCKSGLVSGEVEMNHAGGIRPKEIAAGKFLPCCSTPLTDLVVDRDRKSTRLNSSHVSISYAVFCLKKKTWSMAKLAGAGWRGLAWNCAQVRTPGIFWLMLETLRINRTLQSFAKLPHTVRGASCIFC